MVFTFISRWSAGAALGLLLVLNAPGSANAASIIWDYSPEAHGQEGITSSQNDSNSQNFADKIIFDSAVTITGMDIYGAPGVALNTSATIRLWEKHSDFEQPGSLLASFEETISIIDSDGAISQTDRKHASFTIPLTLKANTMYWIGMSGTSSDIRQMKLDTNPPGDNMMFRFSGVDLSWRVVGDMAFRLHGEISPVPVPAALPLFGTGIALMGLVGWWRRRRDLVA